MAVAGCKADPCAGAPHDLLFWLTGLGQHLDSAEPKWKHSPSSWRTRRGMEPGGAWDLHLLRL